jgi:hypothetical protein
MMRLLTTLSRRDFEDFAHHHGLKLRDPQNHCQGGKHR